jgi:hypothetical protein
MLTHELESDRRETLNNKPASPASGAEAKRSDVMSLNQDVGLVKKPMPNALYSIRNLEPR